MIQQNLPMNTLTNIEVFPNAAIGRKPEVLSEILKEEKNITVYEREIPHLEKDIQSLLGREFELRCSGTLKEIEFALRAGLKNELALCEDAINLLKRFKEISEAGSFRILLEKVETNMCRKFHTDINDLRMLCTYSGQGTMWLPEGAVNRSVLKSMEGNESIVSNNTLVQQVSSGDVVILKGAIYPQKNTKAIVHRSPPIEELGEKRVLFRIDTNEFMNF